MQGVSTSTCLPCVVIGMDIGVLVFEVSITAELFPREGVLLANGVLTGECSAVALFARFSGTGVVDITGCNDALHIP